MEIELNVNILVPEEDSKEAREVLNVYKKENRELQTKFIYHTVLKKEIISIEIQLNVVLSEKLQEFFLIY